MSGWGGEGVGPGPVVPPVSLVSSVSVRLGDPGRTGVRPVRVRRGGPVERECVRYGSVPRVYALVPTFLGVMKLWSVSVVGRHGPEHGLTVGHEVPFDV